MQGLLSLALVAMVFLYSAAGAQTRYVSDEYYVPFRTGAGTQYAITRNLVSGTRVDILEEREDEGYARVRLEDNSEGWVLTQYLQAEQIAEVRLAATTRELSALRERTEALALTVAELEAELALTGQALADAGERSESANTELADIRSASAAALETREQNENLRRRISELTSAAEAAGMQIDDLRGRERQNWFILGAAVLFGGIMIGLIAPKLRRKRRSSW
jgi:SH3 domain protein